jgi:hypothetical protein
VASAVDGVWKFDFLGGHGWEAVGTLVLMDGKVGGGSATCYIVGTYTSNGESITMHTTVQFYGPHKPFFGSKSSRLPVTMEGTLKDDTIRGSEHSPEARDYTYEYRLIKQADLA